MKVINASTIGHLISAHMEGDEQKLLSFANFIADAYAERYIEKHPNPLKRQKRRNDMKILYPWKMIGRYEDDDGKTLYISKKKSN